MFAQRLRFAKVQLRRFVTELARGLEALRDRLRIENDCEARGLKLLREWLSPEQLAQYDANGHFDVTGCDSGKRYRIHNGASMNVHEIDGAGRSRVGWCFVPNADLAAGDVMLAQKIALETDERGALAVAKKFVPSETHVNVFVHL
jgi:hypothetical protein